MGKTFLSHNSEHKNAVEEIARRLINEGVDVWLDKWNLIPGRPWQSEIEKALDSCGCCVIFVGPGGLGPWQHEEMRHAIDRRVREQDDFCTIPVLLPGTDRPDRSHLPSFLAAATWVEFRQTLDDEQALRRLLCGIRGLEPGPDVAGTFASHVCPYRGLDTFYEEHEPFFYGREALSQWLVEHLRPKSEANFENRFLAIIGPSGSGKSSVARAGLLPALRRGGIEGSENWPLLVCRPGADPIEGFAATLATNKVTGERLRTVADVLGVPGEDFYSCFGKDERTLHFAVRLSLHNQPSHQRVLILVDQFEEMFTVANKESARAAINNLLYASSIMGGQTIVVVTMRADFYGRCAEYPALASAVSRHQELVGPMTGEELRRAIEVPAQRVGCEFEAGLVAQLTEAVARQSGALPLLEYTLAQLWEHREARKLTTAAYVQIGEVRGALERRANEVFNQFTPDEQELCRRIFLRITKPGEGTEDTKRRTTRKELGDSLVLEPVISKLIDARLITTTVDAAFPDKSYVEISHEALIRGWPQLRTWLEEDRESFILHHRLIQAVQDWETGRRDASFLYRGARLKQAEEWVSRNGDALSSAEHDFLLASRSEEELHKWNDLGMQDTPDGVAVLDVDTSINWANSKFRKWCQKDDVGGLGFYQALGNPEILGPDFCPFHTALATSQPSISTIRSGDLYFENHAAPFDGPDGQSQYLIVTVRDVTMTMLQQQKLAAIHKAGIELTDLTPDQVFDMGVTERIELLKSNILHYTKDLLNFDVVEIRVKDEQTGRLEALLSYGIDEDAARRPLYACPKDNGVTGFVAATGKSYLCEDTNEDPLYLQGFAGAKSSLTVPLLFHDQVIGTFNVESPEPRAFSEIDLQFLEIFSRDVAVALNLLELMVAQSASTAQESVGAIHGAVALPVDEILNDAVNVMECYIGHEPEVAHRLRRILKNARDIKQVIHEVGQTMAPPEAVPSRPEMTKHAKLWNCRILVVDADDNVRNDAHALLERYGCDVETAHEGGEAVFMVRNCGPDFEYDVIIADIQLPDMTTYDFVVKLRESLDDPVPLILMTGIGVEPAESIADARRAGLEITGVLGKPFRLDQLLETVETMITATGGARRGGF